jgi:hypothetical protein
VKRLLSEWAALDLLCGFVMQAVPASLWLQITQVMPYGSPCCLCGLY